METFTNKTCKSSNLQSDMLQMPVLKQIPEHVNIVCKFRVTYSSSGPVFQKMQTGTFIYIHKCAFSVACKWRPKGMER